MDYLEITPSMHKFLGAVDAVQEHFGCPRSEAVARAKELEPELARAAGLTGPPEEDLVRIAAADRTVAPQSAPALEDSPVVAAMQKLGQAPDAQTQPDSAADPVSPVVAAMERLTASE